MTAPGAKTQDRGLYALLIELPRPSRIRVGALGAATFEAGHYVYIGSARRNLAARLARHRRRRKALRWHVDYLLRRAHVSDTYVWPWRAKGECALVRQALRTGLAERAMRGFGSSDCQCAGHLLRLAGVAQAGWAEELFGRRR